MNTEILEQILKWSENFDEEENKLLLEELALIKDKSKWPSEKTLYLYKEKAELLLSGKRNWQDYANSSGSFYLMRSSLAWHYRLLFLQDLTHFHEQIPRKSQDDIDMLKAKSIKNIRLFLFQMKDLRETLRTDYLIDRNRPVFRKTKRYCLRFLPTGWIDTLWALALNTVPSPNHSDSTLFTDLISVLSLTGVRPSELHRNPQRTDHEIFCRVSNDRSKIMRGDGVVVEHKDGRLVFTVAGSKTGANKGQAWRQIIVSIENEQSQYLRDRILARREAPLVVGLEAFTRITPWLRALSFKCFPTLERSQHVTCYTFRHSVASELKYGKYDGEEIAKVLGQQCVDTQQFYGKSRLGKDGSTIQAAFSSSLVRPRKAKNLHLLKYFMPISFGPNYRRKSEP